MDNRVTFVTFNYDVSLENQLFRALCAIEQFSKGDVVKLFFDESRFIHIYGKVRDDAIASPPEFDLDILDGPSLSTINRAVNFGERVKLLDTVYEASKSIRTIAPSEKSHTQEVQRAIEAIREANCIYIFWDTVSMRIIAGF